MNPKWGLYLQGVALLTAVLIFFALYAWAVAPTTNR